MRKKNSAMRKKAQLPPERPPQSSSDELMCMLIDPMQALARRIGELQRDDLGHLVCSDILIALAELDLRARQLPPAMIENLHATHDAIAAAEAALEAARRAHIRAKAEVLVALGYREKAEALGFKVGIVEEAVPRDRGDLNAVLAKP